MRKKGKLKFAVFGASFWARYQLAAWKEVPDVECVAIYNRTRAKAEALASQFNIPSVYQDAEVLLKNEKLDFIDIISDVSTHARFTRLGLKYRVPVICQKPFTPTLPEARRLVAAAKKIGVSLYVHENWRWQTPIRAVKAVLLKKVIGTPFRARIDMLSGFDVFANQPALKELEQFILTDLGTHILDVARFLFGEATHVTAHTHKTIPALQGENVATVMLKMNEERTTVLCEMAYALTPLEKECFPETIIFIEGDKGSIELRGGHNLRVTTSKGTASMQTDPPVYPWANPAYGVVQSSIVPCNKDLLAGIRGTRVPETTAEDNLKTLALVFAAYESAKKSRTINV